MLITIISTITFIVGFFLGKYSKKNQIALPTVQKQTPIRSAFQLAMVESITEPEEFEVIPHPDNTDRRGRSYDELCEWKSEKYKFSVRINNGYMNWKKNIKETCNPDALEPSKFIFPKWNGFSIDNDKELQNAVYESYIRWFQAKIIEA